MSTLSTWSKIRRLAGVKTNPLSARVRLSHLFLLAGFLLIVDVVIERQYVNERTELALESADSAIALLQALLAQRGPITLRDDALYVGEERLKDSSNIVDAVKSATGFGCTIFQKNVRIATTAVAEGETGRALGTRANAEVTRLVFEKGEVYRGITRTLGKDWVIIYEPLKSIDGSTVGMIATYQEQMLFLRDLSLFRWLLRLTLFGLLVIVSFLVLAVHRQARDLIKAKEMGTYKLVERLGRGGMGEVWKAKHGMLARPAAVKLIRPDALKGEAGFDGEGGLSMLSKRFEREAQATAALESPHTVELYDFGVTDEGVFYYVMEMLNGKDLQSMVQQHGPLPPERVIYLVLQVCDSLADADRGGLIHRDIKPANIYVMCRKGLRFDFVKVLDFGLAKWAQSREAEATSMLSVDGRPTGTPAFMAPEIVLGEKEIDSRVDIYSLGCVAYWLLTGSLVFESDTAMKMLVDHAHTPPVPPSRRTELPIPGDLEQVVMACLEKNPDRRPQNAMELVKMLSDCPVDEPWTPQRAEDWWRTHHPENLDSRSQV